MRMIVAIILFCNFGFVTAQDSLNSSGWKFVNQYGLSFYGLSLFDRTSGSLWGGNEIHVNLTSYRWNRHELGISSGMFFIIKGANLPNHPSMKYFYFPLTVNYKLYSRSNKYYWQFGVGKPMLLYEDTKFMEDENFWLGYEDALTKPGNYVRKKIYGFHLIKFGYHVNDHFSLNIGEMSYLYESTWHRFRNLTRLSFGVEYKL